MTIDPIKEDERPETKARPELSVPLGPEVVMQIADAIVLDNDPTPIGLSHRSVSALADFDEARSKFVRSQIDLCQVLKEEVTNWTNALEGDSESLLT